MRRDYSMKSYLRGAIYTSAIVAWVVLAASGALAQASGGTYDLAVNQTASTSCPAGEPVVLSGKLHLELFVTTITDTTTAPPTLVYVYQVTISSDLSGIGQTARTNYVASTAYSGGSQSTNSSDQFTVVLRYGLDSQDAAPSLMLSQTVNITVDNTGKIGATLVNSATDCVDQPSDGR
jgi:hypothetical protein